MTEKGPRERGRVGVEEEYRIDFRSSKLLLHDFYDRDLYY